MKTTDLTFIVIASRQDTSIIKTLESINSLGRIIIVDGGDRRIQDLEPHGEFNLEKIAELFGADYFYHPYLYSAESYNFAIAKVLSGYVFILDSDEVIDKQLHDWLLAEKYIQNPIYGIRRENIFCGHQIKHGHLGPDFPYRLFAFGSAIYEDRSVHARLIFSAKPSLAEGTILHNSNPTIQHFALKLVAFTGREESARNKTNLSRNEKFLTRKNMRHLKFLGLLRFVHSYVLKRGFLEGKLGFQLAMAAWFYEILVSLRKDYSEPR